MALSGVFTYRTDNGRYGLNCRWSAVQDRPANASTVTLKIYLWQKKSWTLELSAARTVWATIGEDVSSKTAPKISGSVPSNKETLLMTKTLIVPHNPDGTLSLYLRGRYYFNYGGYSYFSASETVELDRILQPTVPQIVTETPTIGSNVLINLPREDESLTHRIAYSFGSLSGTLAEDAGASFTWAVPDALAYEIPNAMQGTCTLTVDTIDDTGAEIGSRSIAFAIGIPSGAIPSITAISIAEANSDTVPPGWGVFVQGKSRLALGVTASGILGSTVRDYRMTVNGETFLSSSATTGLLMTAGGNTLTVTVTDSRGQTATETRTVNVVEYADPVIASVTAERCNAAGEDDDEGGYIRIGVEASISPVSGHNSAVLTIAYKDVNQSEYTVLTTAAIGPDSGYALSEAFVVTIDGGFTTDLSYDMRVSVADGIGTANRYAQIPTAAVIFDIKSNGRGMGIGKVSEQDDTLDVGWKLRCRRRADFDEGAHVNGALTLGAPLPISEGGTGAATAEGARANIGAISRTGDDIHGARFTFSTSGPPDGIGGLPFGAPFEIREAGRAGVEGGTSDLRYAPAIGFHWSWKGSAALALAADRSFWRVEETGNFFRLWDSAAVIPIANGGTGATTAEAARSALGAAAASHTHAMASISDVQFGSNFVRLGTFAICWGQSSVNIRSISSKGFKTGSAISFPITFASAPKVFLASKHNGDYTGLFGYEANAIGTTSFKITVSNPTASTSGSSIDNASIQWVALGFTA